MLYLDHDGVTGSHVKRIDWLHRSYRRGTDGISFILAGGTEEDEGERQAQEICVGSDLSTGVVVLTSSLSGFLAAGSHQRVLGRRNVHIAAPL